MVGRGLGPHGKVRVPPGCSCEQAGRGTQRQCRAGIGPAYTSKAMRSLGLRVGQLKHFDKFKTQFRATVEARRAASRVAIAVAEAYIALLPCSRFPTGPSAPV